MSDQDQPSLFAFRPVGDIEVADVQALARPNTEGCPTGTCQMFPGAIHLSTCPKVSGSAAPPPPSGPQSPIPTPLAGSREAYWAWRRTEDGLVAWGGIQRTVLGLVASGASRISINAVVEQVRSNTGLRINNTWRAYIADELIERYPTLKPLIERRKRKNRA